MKKESKRLLKSIFAASLVAALGFGMVPYQPVSQLFDTAIVASAYEPEIAEGTVAVVNGVPYRTLAGARNAADAAGDNLTVKFYSDSSFDMFARISFFDMKKHSNIVIDTNGHTLKNAFFYYNPDNVVAEGAEPTTRSLTITGNGTLITGSTSFVYAFDKVADNSDRQDKLQFNFEGGVTVRSEKNYAIAVDRVNPNHQASDIEINVKDASIISKSGITVLGNVNQLPENGTPVTINVYDGALIETLDLRDDPKSLCYNAAIYQAGYSELNVYGGTIKGGTAIYSKQGVINISGGTVIGAGNANDYKPSGNGYTPTGDAIVIEDHTGYLIPTKLDVTGGNIISENAQSVDDYTNKANPEDSKVEAVLDGGTFTAQGEPDASVADYVPAENVMLDNGRVVNEERLAKEEGLVVVDKGDGTYTTAVDEENTTYIPGTKNHAWYRLDDEGNLTIYGDGVQISKDSVFLGRTDIKTVKFTDGVKTSTLRAWFRNCTELTEVYNIPDSANANLMFNGCTNLKYVSNMPTITVECTTMFLGCENLEAIGTEPVNIIANRIYGMFEGCKSLKAAVIINGDPQDIASKTYPNIFKNADGADVIVCFKDMGATTAANLTKQINAVEGVRVHDYEEHYTDGVHATSCDICGDVLEEKFDVTVKNFTGTESTVAAYDAGADVTVAAPTNADGSAKKIAWFVNGVRTDANEDGSVSFKAVAPMTAEWRYNYEFTVTGQDGVETAVQTKNVLESSTSTTTCYPYDLVDGKNKTTTAKVVKWYLGDEQITATSADKEADYYISGKNCVVRRKAFPAFDNGALRWVAYYNIKENGADNYIAANETVTFDAPEDAVNGAWYVNGKRIDTLKTAENYAVGEDNTLTVTVCEDISSVEWKEFAGNSMAISTRRKSGTYTKVTLTGKWSVPEGAEVIEAGIARVYAEDCPVDFDANYIYENGSKRISTLKSINGKMAYTLSMNSKSSQKTLCAVSFVTYTLDGVEYTDLSDISMSADEVTIVA